MHQTGGYESSYGAQFRINLKKGKSERKLRQERGHLPGDPALQHRARSIDGVFPDIALTFELQAFEIVYQYSC
jgi:hypothetical protein